MKKTSMKHIIFVLLMSTVFPIISFAAEATDQPVIEILADRTFIYPQRMNLTGEESVMDILQMYPELMIAGYDDMISKYNLRIDNSALNADIRLVLSKTKARDVAVLQICENTGVAKGTTANNGVIDINLLRSTENPYMHGTRNDKTTNSQNHQFLYKGIIEGQGNFGEYAEGTGLASALIGTKNTDIYANLSYSYEQAHQQYLSLHMTNWFSPHDRLLTYFTQQYVETPMGGSDIYRNRLYTGSARYFHNFNDIGTELLLVAGYRYFTDDEQYYKLPYYVVELNTPLFTPRLSMMAGVEGDFFLAKFKPTDVQLDNSYDTNNTDLYLQFTYKLPKWRFTIGERAMFYHYALRVPFTNKQKYNDVRHNANASIIFIPQKNHQIQAAYYRKYYNPLSSVIFSEATTMSDEEWAITKGTLDERDINEFRLFYAYSRQNLTIEAKSSFYNIERGENFGQLGASAHWTTNLSSTRLVLAGGADLYFANSGDYMSLRFAPKAYFPHKWQLGLNVVYYTENAIRRLSTGVPVYGSLAINKQLGTHWDLGLDWHDMFDMLHSRTTNVNRHALLVRAQYRF